MTDTLNNIALFNSNAGSILRNATGTITVKGNKNSDSVNFSNVLKLVVINVLGGNNNITGTDLGDTITGGTGID